MTAPLPRRLTVAFVALVALAAGCKAKTSLVGAPPSAQGIVVQVSPSTASVAVGRSVRFTATVTGTSDGRVAWSTDAGAGAIDPEGVFTASANLGDHVIRATSLADGSSHGEATVTIQAPTAVAVQVQPSTARVVVGGSMHFTATVTGTSDGRVAWSTDAAAGTIDPGGVFTASASVGSHVIRATSLADGTAYGEATVTIYAPTSITVAVTPSPAAVDACRTVQFTATLENATSSAVTWSVQEGAAGGTVDANGLYHAPSTGATYHVVATSDEDPTKSGAAAVTVSEHVLSVAVTPPSLTLHPGQTGQFTATVTSTCGTTTTMTTVRAPAAAPVMP